MIQFRLALAQWRLGRLRSAELPALAGAALDRGLDSPALRQLAGLPASIDYEAVDLLRQVARELDIPIPDEREALLALARSIARQIVDGDVPPYDGARQIWGLCGGDYPEELLAFVDAASDMDDFMLHKLAKPDQYEPLIAACEADIRRAAQQLAKGVAA